jgi:hypothetical protein
MISRLCMILKEVIKEFSINSLIRHVMKMRTRFKYLGSVKKNYREQQQYGLVKRSFASDVYDKRGFRWNWKVNFLYRCKINYLVWLETQGSVQKNGPENESSGDKNAKMDVSSNNEA